MLDRKLILKESKKLGLPARGNSKLLARKITIINTAPTLWSREDFEIILPHLSIHQDLRTRAFDRVESIMINGLNHGMVDSLESIVTGRRQSFCKCLEGHTAYIFIQGSLRYQSRASPYLSAGNKPLFVIFASSRGADIFNTIKSTAKVNYFYNFSE